ncbi:MAG: hypothetical protein A2X61_02790 [Ignavibacteria bacterium GWB2_35_12]|nr:MAG: hypothetical protein A2X63_07330 [Ignavibacteria bacterium GWA2_35_8]OGU38225.1 MAG: hypothetical protein A2X61_02790 [Ignavibacteria bacterium GWB2_35_12]OGU95445.1 MAG: hypothetical protein A2220_06965 [Ignavibacteria bacterium RIFOXYA2_FULL_35_10]OGV20839.1 MAG: hypothetical protein A2475_11760 [Ignavibacteria bacterium RIFOXYC2_FULL_35_21]
MYYNNLEITGFRGIKHLKIDGFGDINLLVGKNNSCKTTVLEALFLLTGISNAALVETINRFRDLISESNEDFSFIFHNLDFESKLVLKAFLNNNKFKRELSIIPSYIKENGKKIDEAKFKQLQSYETSIQKKVINELLFNFSIFEKNKNNYQSKLGFKDRELIAFPTQNYKEKLFGFYITPKYSISHDIHQTLEDIIVNKKKDEIINILQLIEPNIKDISFGLNRMIFVDIGVDKLLPLNLQGSGTIKLLQIILALYKVKDGIIFIDELENGFHFSTLKDIWKIIIETSKKNNIQVFVTSHNLDTLKFLKSAIEENEDKSSKNRVRSITLRRLPDDSIKSYVYNFEQFEFSLEQGIEIR